MFKFLTAFLLAGVLCAQTTASKAPIPQAKDSLGRTTPQDSVFQFLEACHARDYTKAILYLDLKKIPAAQRAKDGPDLARQLADLLDDTSFEITTLSRDPEGDQTDGLAPATERLATFEWTGDKLLLHLGRGYSNR